MVSIDLYKCTAPPNVVNKNLFCTDKKTISGQWYEGTSILTPVLKLKKDTTVLSYNYCYISDMGNRWYYINNIDIDGPFMYLYCQVDELETYKADLIGQNAPAQYVERQANVNNINRDITDDMMPLEEEPQYDIAQFPNTPFKTESIDSTTNYVCVLVTSGFTFKDGQVIVPENNNEEV